MKTADELARIQRLLNVENILCRDGATMAILTPCFIPRLQRDDPPVRLRVVPEDPIVKATGMEQYWVHHDRSEGVDAEYAQVPIAVVRAWIRGHGGFHWAGPRALEELQRAGEIEKAQHAAAQGSSGRPPAPATGGNRPARGGRRRPFCPPAASPGAAVSDGALHLVQPSVAPAPVSYRSLAKAVAQAREAITRAKAPPLVAGRPPETKTQLHQAARGKVALCRLATWALRMHRDADDADESLRAEAAALAVGLVAAEADARKAANAVGAY